MALAPGRDAQGSEGLTTWAVARRGPAIVAQAVRLGWRTDRAAVIAVAVAQVLGALATAVALAATAMVLGTVFASGEVGEGLRTAVSPLALAAGGTAFRYVADAGVSAAVARLAPAVVREADLSVIRASTRAELVAHEDPEFADAHDAAHDGAHATGDLIEDAQALTGAGAQLVAAAAVVTALHPVLLPLLLAGVAPRAWGAVRAARIGHAAHRRTVADRRLRQTFRDYTTDRNTADEVRAASMAPYLTEQYTVISRRLEREQLVAARRSLLAQGTGDAVAAVATVGCWAALVVLAVTGRVEAAAAGAAALAVRTAGAGLTSAVRAGAGLFRTSLSLGDWTAFLAAADRFAARRGPITVPARGPQVITARGASFTYPGAARPALERIDLEIRRGEVIALVGENGSGKTTLAKLLTGLYLPTGGAVCWDGIDLADADPDSVMSCLSVVPQDYTRWPLAARENITLGRPRAGGDQAVHSAARAAGADTVVASLPAGLDTSLARSWWGGHDLSGGQWQRIAIARAFHQDGSVLVMDEPTAALDARAEHAVFSRLRELAAGRSTVFITHRLANARLADRIIVLQDGHVVQDGTFDDLATGPGPFGEMLKLQEG